MKYSILLFYIVSFCLLLLFLVLDLIIGSVPIPIEKILAIVFLQENENTAWVNILYKIRIPKSISAMIAGASLAISGLQMQTLFRNPLAGPSVLGITSGASLGIAFVMLGTGSVASAAAIGRLGFLGSWLIVFASISGSLLVLLLVLLLSYRMNDNVVLLIIGMMIAGLTNSLVTIWQYFSQPEQIQDFLLWTFGSLGGVNPDQLFLFSLISLIGILTAFASSKYLNMLLLGDHYAKSMGLNITKARWFIIGSTSILTGTVTAFCGPIGFIGIAVPHITRSFLNSADHKLLIPANFFMGAILMLFCDIVSHLPQYQVVLPINAITSLIGAPIVIWVILKGNNLRNSF